MKIAPVSLTVRATSWCWLTGLVAVSTLRRRYFRVAALLNNTAAEVDLAQRGYMLEIFRDIRPEPPPMPLDPPDSSPEAVVREFWRLMATNDFHSVAAVLAPDLVVEWPQSGERIRGAGRFCQMNAEYPTTGRWRFRINRLVASGDSVVTQVSLGDGEQSAEPISFFTVQDGRITRLLEYWPEPFAPAENRRHLVERMD